MRRIAIIMVALLLALSMISCGRVSQRQVEKMIEDAVEEALEEQAEEVDKDKEDEKDEEEQEEQDEKDRADEKDEGNGGSTSFGYNYAGEEIPEDFPAEAIPLYESADASVIGAIRAVAGEDVTYEVGIGTDNKIKNVAEDVKKALQDIYSKSEIQEMAMGEYYMYVVTSSDWTFTINVMDGEEEGYETIVTYAVLSN